MKTKIIAISLLLTGTMVSCTKNLDSPSEPTIATINDGYHSNTPPTQTSSMTATLSTSSNPYNFGSTSVSASNSGGYVYIQDVNGDIVLSAPAAIGTYLASNTATITVNNIFSAGTFYANFNYSCSSGSITISSISGTQVSGTFSGYIIYGGCPATYYSNLTSGKFTALY